MKQKLSTKFMKLTLVLSSGSSYPTKNNLFNEAAVHCTSKIKTTVM